MMEFDDLYLRYAQQVRRFVGLLTGDWALADDVTSETFVKAWNAADEIRAATVKSYLFTIARNLCRDAFRQRANRTSLDDAGELIDGRPSPDSRVEWQNELRAVFRELAKLSEIDRAALLLRVHQEMSYEEIGEILQITASAARVKVHRARLKLMQVRSTPREVPYGS